MDVVQIIGGMGSLDSQIDGAELAWRLAEKLGGRCYYLRARLVVASSALCRALMQERDIRGCLNPARRAKFGLVGIGSVVPEVSSLLRPGYLTRRELEEIGDCEAVGDICRRHFDVQGREWGLELNERIVGIALHRLEKIQCVVEISGAAKKAKAISGALRGFW